MDSIVKNKYQRTLKPIQKRAGCHVTINTHSKIDFSSNDTLSLSTEPCLLDALNTIQFTQFGSTGSRLLSGDYDLIVLDEIINILAYGLLEVRDLIKLLKEKPQKTSVVLTGRGAHGELIDIADTVSEIKEIKHVYSKGIKAKKGIEY